MFYFFKKTRSFGQVCDEWGRRQVQLSKEIRESTKESKLIALRTVKSVGPIDVCIKKLRYSHFEEIKRVLLKTNKPKTVNRYLSILKQMFKWSYRMEYIERIPDIDRCRVYETDEVEFLSLDQFDKLMYCMKKEVMSAPKQATGQVKSYWAIKIITYTGIRPKEIRILKWNMVDFERGFLSVPACAYNKGNKRRIKLSPQALEAFNHMPKYDQHYINPFHGLGNRSHTSRLAWIKQKYNLDFRVYPQIFRNSFCTWALAYNLMAIQEVSAYLGHQNLDTTARYYTNKQCILDKSAPFIEKLDFNKIVGQRRIA